MTAATTAGTSRTLLLMRIAELRAWLFLIVLVVFFESWAQLNGT